MIVSFCKDSLVEEVARMNTLLPEDKKFEAPAVYKAKHFHAEVISEQRQLASEMGIKWHLSLITADDYQEDTQEKIIKELSMEYYSLTKKVRDEYSAIRFSTDHFNCDRNIDSNQLSMNTNSTVLSMCTLDDSCG